MPFLSKDFIGMKNVSAEEVLYILNTAETMKHVLNQKNKKSPYLQGKSVILLFYEPSPRLQTSYNLAAQYLSAGCVDMSVSTDMDGEGGLIEIGRMIDQMGGDYIVIRHPMSGTAKLMAENVNASVINAGDGMNEEPVQSIVDLLTIKKYKGGFKDLKVTIIGDVAYSRVSKSNIFGLVKLGAKVSVASPPTLVPAQLSSFGVDVFHDAREAAKGADVIMVLRALEQRCLDNYIPSLNEYKNFFKVDLDMVDAADKDVLIMHPGPIKRGIEISSHVINSRHCLVDDRMAAGVAARMALLYLLSLKTGGELI